MSHETNSIVKPHLPKSDFVICLILITCSHTFISKSKSSEDKSNRFAVTYHNSKGHQHNQLLVFQYKPTSCTAEPYNKQSKSQCRKQHTALQLTRISIHILILNNYRMRVKHAIILLLHEYQYYQLVRPKTKQQLTFLNLALRSC